MNLAKSQTWFVSMYFSTQTLLFFFIVISISWNVYNTYQYRLVVERQRIFENLLTDFFPSSSSLPFDQTITIEQWIHRIISKERSDNTEPLHIIRRERRYVPEATINNCLCPPEMKGEKGERGLPGFPGEMGPKGERGQPGSIVWNGIKGEKGEPGRGGEYSREDLVTSLETRVIQGPPGPPGPPGPKGDVTPMGYYDMSKVGPPGQDGLPGEKGDRGERGLQGPAGIKGEKGDEGKRGFRGRPGSPGPAGMDALPCPRELLLNFDHMCQSCCKKP